MAVEHNQSRNIVAHAPVGGVIAELAGRPLLPNAGIPLNLDWLREVRVNTSAVERRAQSQVARRTVKKEWQAAWLLRAITCMDLTTLSGDDTDERVRRLCAKGRHPIQPELEKKLGIEELQIKVAAICVYHTFVETAVHALEGSGIHVAAVSTGFPAGLSPLAERVNEIHRSVEAGAHEIDVVITRAHVFGGRWQALYDEVAAFKRACGSAHLKVILGTGDLLTLRNVARASAVAMMAGADFIKTSTGKELTNATLPVGLVMTRAIREYAQQTGMAVGFKPAGGIRTAKQSIDWLAMIKEELGPSWLRSEMFRFGASGLLGDIERQLEHSATGRYSAEYRHPIA
ncbi:MAG TPA: deoxyribose-phosphate aldolase [Terriglobales bacterium]|jgi:deoxyribose-phosphate aldolase|nr:deoxyribose-phosphate aldolase [Terriglobales bacterium]